MIIPEDFRIEVVPVHFKSDNTTEYEVQMRWTAPSKFYDKNYQRSDGSFPFKDEVVYLTNSKSEIEAKKITEQAKKELKELVAKW